MAAELAEPGTVRDDDGVVKEVVIGKPGRHEERRTGGGPTSKRPAAAAAAAPAAKKVEDGSNDLDISASSLRPSKVSKKECAPDYGSKDYWESRYKSHANNFECYESNDIGNVVISKDKDAGETTAATTTAYEPTTPGHEWYFSYDELQPLIMPLILGESDCEVDESEYDQDADSWIEEEDQDVSDQDVEVDRDGGEEELIEELENEDMVSTVESACGDHKASADDTAEQPNEIVDANSRREIENACLRTGLSHSINKRPKRVLEVGCGDKPLGTALVRDLLSMQAKSHEDVKSIVNEVTCIDYSDTVVQRLIEMEKKEHDNIVAPMDGLGQQSEKFTNLRPTFQALDARSLPFRSNAYDLVLEKGTLDAMLSDKENGLTNCIQIVKEMARVTSDGGAMFIVSHLNANEPKGMMWLEDVVFNGLKAEFLERSRPKTIQKSEATNLLEKRESSDGHSNIDEYEKECVWSVEVHGGHGARGDTNRDNEENPDENTDDDEDNLMVYGPAVYIIRKKSIALTVARELFGKKRADGFSEGGDGDEDAELIEMPPVKLSFLSYDGE